MNLELVKQLTNAFGPSGFEDEVVKVVKQNCKEFDCTSDAMHNIFMKMKNHTGKKPVVMLDAHLDELGFMVKHISSNGLISFVTLGGWVATNVPAHSVYIRNRKGELIKGITTSKPPHFMTEAERTSKLQIESICIDVGASSYKEVTELFGIQVGDPVMPDALFEHNKINDTLFGKAFDNRVGCYCIIETMKRLINQSNLYVDVVGGFAAQEENGTRGAKITANTLKPDLAIVFEGSPSDDMYYDILEAQGALKKGTQIRHIDSSYVSNPEFIAFAKEVGDKNGIKYQSAVRRSGGTNAGVIHQMADKNIPCLVLGIPCRYVHSHYNWCAIEDIEATASMATEVIKALNQTALDKIFFKD
ncbi:MAG: M20/M25/M40 family metallo-hydrolase [Oscillospiraceae bacterium]